MVRLTKFFLKISVVFLLVLVGLVSGYWQMLEHFADTPGDHDVRVEFEIIRGETPKHIAVRLQSEHLISSANKFYIYLRFVAKKAQALKAGYYLINGTDTPDQIISLLQKGLKKEFPFTVPEGANKNDIAQIISNSGLASKDEVLLALKNPILFDEMVDVPELFKKKNKVIPGGIEGYLFPDTYRFPKGTSVEIILRKMNSRMLQQFDEAVKSRMAEYNWNLHEVLTLASIIEKETGVPEERNLIASIFLNRLKIGMRLQSDPTVIYGIKNYQGNIKKKDLNSSDVYNTYAHSGLPPGPIASPGLESIRAVLWPAKTKYLYFVSKNDGTHEFCENYLCHQKAVNKWQVKYFKNIKPAK
ncbi:MAG: endolytic transglycosylase MltG [bacterium]|nr:endolytic transglycosylase MltG [bacterium]